MHSLHDILLYFPFSVSVLVPFFLLLPILYFHQGQLCECSLVDIEGICWRQTAPLLHDTLPSGQAYFLASSLVIRSPSHYNALGTGRGLEKSRWLLLWCKCMRMQLTGDASPCLKSRRLAFAPFSSTSIQNGIYRKQQHLGAKAHTRICQT